MNDSSWKRLLDKIQESNVVPIIGARLLVGSDGQTSLQGQVAKRLLEDCGKSVDAPLPPFRELNEAVSMLRGSIEPQDLYDLYDAIRSVIHPSKPAIPPPIPTPILQLAQISSFRLFVTLTPDDLLARSLQKRCAVNEIVHSPTCCPPVREKTCPTIGRRGWGRSSCCICSESRAQPPCLRSTTRTSWSTRTT